MGSRNIRLLIAYDGTDFSGWQRQGNGRSVQGEIERALEKIHHEPVHLIGSGRTDAGVHAIGQVANFHTSITSIPAERFVMALNALLPQDVRILEAREASPDFHARFDARYRTYRYFFVCGRPALPQELRYAHQLWRVPDIRLLSAYCRVIHGELDCSLFASAGDSSLSRHRYIVGCRFIQEGSYLVFEITANAFLWKMVRSIVGTLLFYEERGLAPEEFERIVLRGNRKEAGPTVPPRGLFLWHIDYYRN
ncbi:MAG TPA: tRNA pseudouridine(38-40) synthase TruA [Termitinemataceae bacterium]|jgi:tRNA pseudouridine38-40 synthase|uniref:tRNA pseudouridine(38-40) synthase TruA n=1 Tax=Treponema sp. J25 TaxID=2094121 RepID=UPI0010455E68|nr:tRNA pseudouridine(38-40) synthase TruA [Treponema sp. J25]TCW62643.1 tRNA pseudouridine(38-40) synthase TruA [Treponema sp. J25]HOJ98332.1 tRNA pseudouridine(38-40) synthase TruA [Termitinemataceae bacterium]HOM22695.1 tRNA pseudouridine(38-40) synthase TruA [Termitinemataceae bacterium]HPP99534.1 tRNA pseudouridine(38-40) synthase TruA [Termitinemataceae bacterium]